MSRAWCIDSYGNPLLRVMLKLKTVKFAFKAWVAVEFGNVKV